MPSLLYRSCVTYLNVPSAAPLPKSTSTQTTTSGSDTPSPQRKSLRPASALAASTDRTSRCLFASFSSAFLLRTRLARLNKRRAEKIRAMTEEESEQMKSRTAENEEVWDDDPRYVFMT